ncbi:Putative phosphotransacetylase [Elusimicrobium minutum Pei191]|uniref:Putative phosphotransacetylase n=1 Tax=Elusimicrobium minutum (strain Pei191) TaxID=445932 RepID=B2KEH1_ELUMP|nr:phosphate acyltransferase [Elusimicrobium minutum]ACC98917.1 Putative phosphotransacetylase [Elusimicrobium minutum Pei191]
MKFKNFTDLITQVKGKSNRVVVPGANNSEALEAIKMADENGLISSGILIGPEAQVKEMMSAIGLKEDKFTFIECADVPTMCNLAVEQIIKGNGDFLVKGLVDTKYYMKAILNKEAGLVPEGAILTHFVLFEAAKYKKMFAVSDSAILISPTLEQKVKIINNAVSVFNKIGVENPKVSMVCPVEKVNEKIPSTVDAAALVEMNKKGDIKGCVIEGPYDVYMTFSKELAAEKGIKNAEIPGDVDLCVLPDLDAANPLYKALTFFGEGVKAATILVGAKIPVILPSRADAPNTKLNAIALCSFLKDQK